MLSCGIEWVLSLRESSDYTNSVGSSVCITRVEPGSPACLAGLAERDIITSVDRQTASKETIQNLNRNIRDTHRGKEGRKKERKGRPIGGKAKVLPGKWFPLQIQEWDGTSRAPFNWCTSLPLR